MLHLLIDARGTMDFVNDAGSFFLAVNKNISSFFFNIGNFRHYGSLCCFFLACLDKY